MGSKNDDDVSTTSDWTFGLPAAARVPDHDAAAGVPREQLTVRAEAERVAVVAVAAGSTVTTPELMLSVWTIAPVRASTRTPPTSCDEPWVATSATVSVPGWNAGDRHRCAPSPTFAFSITWSGRPLRGE